jgi:transcription-repair coupling factor (superfamily II helicase)
VIQSFSKLDDLFGTRIILSSTTIQRGGLESALKRIKETPEYQQLLTKLRNNEPLISISGLVAGSARALALTALQRDTGKTFAIVTQATRDLEPWEEDLRFWYCALNGTDNCEREVLVIPASESDPYAGVSPHAQTLEKRALSLWRLRQQTSDFVLLTARALARKSISPADIEKAGAILRRDEDHSPEQLADKLIATGYVREDPVSAVGEFSSRGGILDVWPPGSDSPVRLEFFGDMIDSLREFDPETQLSTGQLQEIEVTADA